MFRSTGTIRLPQWAVTRRFVYADDVDFNPYREQQASDDADLSSATIYFAVRDRRTHAVVIQKSSSDINEIEILTPPTSGVLAIKFVEADTAALKYSKNYYFDVWGDLGDGRIEPIIDRGNFYVMRSATRISTSPTHNLPGGTTTPPTSPIYREGTIVEETAREGVLFESEALEATVSVEGTTV